MKKEGKNRIHRTSIGGQAVMEGVMMRGPHKIATAVRKPDGEIIIEEQGLGKVRKSKILKLPIIRGCINFFDSMIIGVKALMFSAKFFEVEEEDEAPQEPESKFEQWLEKKLGSEKALNAVIYSAVVFSLLLSVGLFFFLPMALTTAIQIYVKNHVVLTLLEGVVRIVIFLLYLTLVSQTKDIKRVFMYHGAEHKSIFCYEHGEELTVDNVRRYQRFHPRCGTSFLLIVMVISIVAFSVISWNDPVGQVPLGLRLLLLLRRFGLRLLMLPVVAGVSYEIIKLAGRHENWFTKALSAPGMWLQRITTREPDDSQIEVAIAALQAVMPENKEEDKW